MDIYNEFDVYENALKKCNLDDEAMPTCRGRVVEDVETYNKIQRLLNTNELEACHKYLYNIDVDEITEDEKEKVDKLYDLGKEKGLIKDTDEDSEDEESEENSEEKDTEEKEEPKKEVKKESDFESPSMGAQTQPSGSAFTVMYSAMKDGEIKVGEAYSNSINPRSAKADVLAKLANCGYSNISVLAIEAGDPDMVGCDSEHNCIAHEGDFKKFGKYADLTAARADIPPMFNPPMDEPIKDSPMETGDDDAKKFWNKDVDDPEYDKFLNSKILDADDEESSDKEKPKEKEDKKEKEEKTEPEDTDDDKDAEEEAPEEPEGAEKKELSTSEKTELKDSYSIVFKNVLKKLKIKEGFDSLDLQGKIDFFTEISKLWQDKPDPSEFMTDKEQEKLNKVTLK